MTINSTANRGKQGFTLIELLVYMGLLGIIVVVAGKAFTDSTGFRIRTEGMLKGHAEARDVAAILREDLNQMGAKTSFETDGATVQSDAFVDATSETDKSSFSLNKDRDTIVFNKIVYDESGSAQYVQRVSWMFVPNEGLYRGCKTLWPTSADPAECHSSDSDPVLMSNKVQSFKLWPGTRLEDGESGGEDVFAKGSSFTLAPRTNSTNTTFFIMPVLTPDENGTSVDVKGLQTNDGHHGTRLASQLYLLDGGSSTLSAEAWTSCKTFSFEEFATYAVSMNISSSCRTSSPNYMCDFQAGVDHIGIGFRTPEGELIPGIHDFMTYPTQSISGVEASRYAEFSIPTRIENACLAITIALYSPEVYKGNFSISNIAIYKRNASEYVFNTTPGSTAYGASTDENKNNVKAFKLEMDVSVNKEISHVENVILTPNNGTEG